MDRLEVAVEPRFPRVLPRLIGGDRVVRRRGPWLERLILEADSPMILRVRPDRKVSGGGHGCSFVLVAEPVEPERVAGRSANALEQPTESDLKAGIARLRHAFGLDDDLDPFRDRFRSDELLGPVIRRRLVHRPARRADPWEALLWAITEQLIEYRRAAAIQRRVVRKFGLRVDSGPGEGLASVPAAGVMAAAAPAELQALDLGGSRAVAAVKTAREVAAGRIDPGSPDGDARLLRIPAIGPWTVACLALRGRGDQDALLAGDLAQMKLVGYLGGLGRPAEVEEVEEFYGRYAPYRGLAGELLAAELGGVVEGPGNRARVRIAARA